MKILHIITRSEWGGAQKVVFELAQWQQAAGHEVAVMCGEQGRLTKLLYKKGIAVKENRHLHRTPGIMDVLALYEIWLEIHRGYDLVHAHSTKAGILVRLLRVWRRFPVCFTVHGFGVTPDHAHWEQCLYDVIERNLARYTDGLIFVSSADLQVAELKGWLKQANKVGVIPNGISPYTAKDLGEAGNNLCDLRQELGIPAKGFVIGNLARVAWVKNPELWLKVAVAYLEQNTEAYFVWFGGGPLLGRMRGKVSGLTEELRSRIFFAGEVENIEAALASLDVLLVSSRSEGMPMAVLEAMQQRKAILAPALPGLVDVLGPRSKSRADDESVSARRLPNSADRMSVCEAEAAAILYKPGDVGEIVQALHALEDSVTRDCLGKIGEARVLCDYSAERMAASYEKLYLEVSQAAELG